MTHLAQTAALNAPSSTLPSSSAPTAKVGNRVAWIDGAKGICIILVVMMNTVLGLEAATGDTGWMHAVVEFSKPFRMPDFFMVAGLFLVPTLTRNWGLYLDRKVVHFVYFYVLWLTIQFAFKAPFMVMDGLTPALAAKTYLLAFVQPWGSLWFIWMLPFFFIAARLFWPYKYAMLGVAALLQIAPIHTGGLMASVSTTLGLEPSGAGFVFIDEGASFFVFFLMGAIFAPQIFALADWAGRNKRTGVLALLVWFATNLLLTSTGAAGLPVIALLLGMAGAVAIVIFARLMADLPWMDWLRIIGSLSIVVYLAFFFPMVIMRLLLLKFAPGMDAGTMGALSTAVAVVSPVVLHWVIGKIGVGYFLFVRPKWATFGEKSEPKREARLEVA
ncbi:acyltransferase family protein [Ahrensia sp. R2A130]|uniref:acyltransferase family protein n=1 Tax=Ahrensia sp. R2A130 TaxID=744979 RepID=UPI0003099E8B|nr:acyltransferase family protein [Ahrensia sp. R2A130]